MTYDTWLAWNEPAYDVTWTDHHRNGSTMRFYYVVDANLHKVGPDFTELWRAEALAARLVDELSELEESRSRYVDYDGYNDLD